MAWRWYKRFRLFGGANANLSNNGIGWSWGIGILRFGVSPSGRRWVSIGIPGTGFRYFKYLRSPPPDSDIENEANSEQPSPTIKEWKNLK